MPPEPSKYDPNLVANLHVELERVKGTIKSLNGEKKTLTEDLKVQLDLLAAQEQCA